MHMVYHLEPQKRFHIFSLYIKILQGKYKEQSFLVLVLISNKKIAEKQKRCTHSVCARHQTRPQGC